MEQSLNAAFSDMCFDFSWKLTSPYFFIDIFTAFEGLNNVLKEHFQDLSSQVMNLFLKVSFFIKVVLVFRSNCSF